MFPCELLNFRLNHMHSLRSLPGLFPSNTSSLFCLYRHWSAYTFLEWFEMWTFKQAYDLVGHRYVACKLHGLNAQWSEEKKQSYIRHAVREYNIHKTLLHPHIVRLWDIFEIDHNTFCTVLEYCSGIMHFLDHYIVHHIYIYSKRKAWSVYSLRVIL